MWRFLLLPLLVSAQQNIDPETVAEGVDSFKKLYGIASQIMELSGNIMGGSGGQDSNGYRALGGEIRPSFRGVRNFETDNTVTSGSSQQSGLENMARLISQYGGGFLAPVTQPTTTTTTTPKPNAFQSLFNTFLGSSVDTPDALPPPPTPRPRSSNIMGLFGNSFAPTQSPAAAKPNSNFMGLLGNSFGANPAPAAAKPNGDFMGLLGGFLPTTQAPTTRQPSLLGMFGVPNTGRSNRDTSSSPTSLGKINLWELMGMAPRTTTTTQAPLQALLSPKTYSNDNAQNIDAVINALMKSNAQPAAREEVGPASFLSQFFGGK